MNRNAHVLATIIVHIDKRRVKIVWYIKIAREEAYLLISIIVFQPYS